MRTAKHIYLKRHYFLKGDLGLYLSGRRAEMLYMFSKGILLNDGSSVGRAGELIILIVVGSIPTHHVKAHTAIN